jgi:hypothetical protein
MEVVVEDMAGHLLDYDANWPHFPSPITWTLAAASHYGLDEGCLHHQNISIIVGTINEMVVGKTQSSFYPSLYKKDNGHINGH